MKRKKKVWKAKRNESLLKSGNERMEKFEGTKLCKKIKEKSNRGKIK